MEKKKEDEQNRNFHVWFFDFAKVSGVFRVNLAIE